MTRRRILACLLLFAAWLLPGVAGATTAAQARPVVLVVGDSLSAAYGLAPGQGWVDLLAARLAAEGYRHQTVNASISGDTTAGGRARLPALLSRHRPAIVVIELGGNDGLRGGSLRSTRENLDAMVVAAQKSGARVLVLGMRLPPNYGPAYTREFDAVFSGVAAARKAALVPFLLEGFGDDMAYFQPDRIHPTAAAQPKLLANVWPALVPLLGRPPGVGR
jgi:acyl-CoA thioesterase-1